MGCVEPDCMSGDCQSEAGKSRSSGLDDSDSDDIWLSSDNEQNNEFNFHPNTDEFYGSAEQNHENTTEMSLNLIALQRRHAKQGYLDGLSQAKETGLQDGFDEGYPIGGKLGVAVGQLLISLKMSQISGKLSQEQYDLALKELNIRNILQKKYFDNSLNIKDYSKHPVISKWVGVVANDL
ncbi:unnamed protein product [Ambrosiozyma monospora]|uniref:Unnamed protein product n=1 Tax=Ambrosiozyma monospora TaxID=43982 RepID=A0A9W6YTL0_AMBMO|nr:unnamed protein product [Ambrosiozyma monospora]